MKMFYFMYGYGSSYTVMAEDEQQAREYVVKEIKEYYTKKYPEALKNELKSFKTYPVKVYAAGQVLTGEIC